jgi:thiamine pyrophosphokinase
MGLCMSRFTILLGGDLTPTSRLAAQAAGTRVIAADSGILHAAALGLTPELWVGDFDSVTEEVLHANEHIPRAVFAAEKDFTDGELAVKAARERGASEILFIGAFGGPRPDHAFLHITQAIALAESGLSIVLTSGLEEGVPLMPGRHDFDYASGTLFSILPFGDLAGLTIEGGKWPLDAVEVAFGSSLTISNEVRGTLRIGLERGRAVLLAHLTGQQTNS